MFQAFVGYFGLGFTGEVYIYTAPLQADYQNNQSGKRSRSLRVVN